MTLTTVLKLSLARVGLNTTSTPFVDRAREYFNLGTADLVARRKWRWLFKTGTITTTAATALYDLASDVSRPLSFINTTDNIPIRMVDVEEVDNVDPDRDQTSGARFAYIKGINATNGYWQVEFFPIPDTSSETITYRYYAHVPEKSSGDDGTDLDLTMPRIAQSAMVDWVTARYKGEKGDSRGEQEEMATYLFKLDSLAEEDKDQEGNRLFQFPRRDHSFSGLTFNVQDGSLS